jgi:DNA recombination protein RmuC
MLGVLEMETLVIAMSVTGILLGIAIGIVVGRYVCPSLAQAQADIARREGAAREEVARLTERMNNLTRQLEDQGDVRKQLTTEFENIATRILKSNTDQLSDTSQKTLGELINPLRERIKEFQDKVEVTYDNEKRDVLSLKALIQTTLDTSQKVGGQADDLAKALRGDSQLLGRWGELALETLLEAAGLEEGRGYIKQGKGLNLKSEDGAAQKPDFIVKLPDGRSFIVDSKANLSSYDKMIAASDDSDRKQHGKQLVKDLKAGIDDLHHDHYQGNAKLRSHEAVLMFIPIEGCLAAALKGDPSLFTYAWDRGVVLVGPSTLMMTMSTVASMWQYQEQKGKAHEIADLAGKLCSKFCDSIDDLNTIGKKLNEAIHTHDGAMRRLFHGKGNALSIMEGIRGRRVDMKPIPSVVIGGILVAPEKDEDEDAHQTGKLNSSVSPTDSLPQNGTISGTLLSPK